MDSAPSLSALRLLVPPLRLVSAFMWRVAQQQNLEHYADLENFVSMVTKMIPDIISHRQKATLVMGLRAKVLLEMCRGDLPVDSDTIKTHLHQVQSSHLLKSSYSEMDNLQSNLLNLILQLLEDPVKKEEFFQRVYPVEYGPDFDKALQVLVCYCITRLEQLLPIPNFKQVASWMNSPSLWNECKKYASQTEDIQWLLQDNCHRSLDENDLPSVVEDRIISSLSLPPTAIHRISSQSKSCLGKQTSSSHQENQEMLVLHQNCQVVPTTSGVDMDGHGQSNRPHDADLKDDIETELTLSKYALREKGIAGGSGVSDFTAEKLKCPDTSDQNHSELFSGGLLMNTTVPLEEFCLTFTVNKNDPTMEVPPAETHPGNIINLNANQTAPAQESSQQTALLVLSDISNNRQNDWDDPEKMCSEASQSVSHAILDQPSRGSSSGSHAESLESGQAERKCPRCSRCFAYDSDVLRHLCSHAGVKPRSEATHQCPRCRMRFSDASVFAAHKLKHLRAPTYRCPTCGLIFGSLTSWHQHQKTHKASQFQCSHCDREFERLSGLLRHQQAHRDLQDSSPSSCTQEELKEAKPTVAQISQSECKFCGKNFPTVLELKNHLMTHTELKPYHCKHCEKSFVSKFSVQAHMANHTGEKPYLCQECGKTFCGPSQFRSHMKMHSATQQHCCPHCGKLFSQLGNLNVHIRIHTGEKPYLCSTCGKSFKSAGDLQVHMRFHTGERPYKCEVCDRRFATSSHRLVHARMHTGERPFSCSICGKRFVRKGCYRKHMQVHSGERPYKCPECPKSYTRSTHLKMHRRTHRK